MIEAVIFDLDGVIVSTDEYHYQAWKIIADEEDVYFDRNINERLRGVSRSDSLNIILENAKREYSIEEKERLLERKNNIYKEYLKKLTPNDILPGVFENMEKLKAMGIKMAVGSSSKNTQFILEQIEIKNYFNVIVDGNSITKSKPDPEVFLKAASLLKVEPEKCMVVEDAHAGIDAAKKGGFVALAVGYSFGYKKADYRAKSLKDIDLSVLITEGKERPIKG